MNPSAAAFIRACDQNGLKHSTPQLLPGGQTSVSLGINGSHGVAYTFRFFFGVQGNDVAIRVFRLGTGIPEHLRSGYIQRCNRANNRHRWLKVVLDPDGDINLEADCIITPETAGDTCMELLRLLAQALDDAYPGLFAVICF